MVKYMWSGLFELFLFSKINLSILCHGYNFTTQVH
jgi:hypothetical protein